MSNVRMAARVFDLPFHILVAGWLLRKLLPNQTGESARVVSTQMMYEYEFLALGGIHADKQRTSSNIVVKFLNYIVTTYMKKLSGMATQLWLARIKDVIVIPITNSGKENDGRSQDSECKNIK